MKVRLFSSKARTIGTCLAILLFSIWLLAGQSDERRQVRKGLAQISAEQNAQDNSQPAPSSLPSSSAPSSRKTYKPVYSPPVGRAEPSIHTALTQAINDVSDAIQSTLCHEVDCVHLLEARDSLELEYLSRKVFEARLHPRILEQSMEDIKNFNGSKGESFRAYMMASDLGQYQDSVMGKEILFPRIKEDEPFGVLVTDEFQFVFYDGYALTIGSMVNHKQEILSIREESMDVEDVKTGEVTTIEFEFPYLRMMMVREEGFPSLFSNRPPIPSWEEFSKGWKGKKK